MLQQAIEILKVQDSLKEKFGQAQYDRMIEKIDRTLSDAAAKHNISKAEAAYFIMQTQKYGSITYLAITAWIGENK